MKKLLVLLLSVVAIMSLIFMGVGCKEEAAPAEEKIVEEATAEEEVTEEAPAEEEVTEEASKGTIYFLAYEMQNAVNILFAETIENYIEELGYEPKILSCDVKSDVQVQQMETAITTNPVAIIVVPVEPSTLIDGYVKAREMGILVISLDAWIEDTVADMNSVTGVKKLGQLAAEETIARLQEKYGEAKGKVFQLMGDTSSGYTTGIREGFDAVITEQSGIELITKDNPQWSAENAVNTIVDQVTVNRDYDAIFVHADSRIPLIVPALEEQGYGPGDIILSGTDGDPGALDMIKQGWLTFTESIPVPQQAKGTLFFLNDLLAGNEIEEGIYNIDGIDVELVNEEWGPTLYFPGINVSEDNVDDPTLWGNTAK